MNTRNLLAALTTTALLAGCGHPVATAPVQRVAAQATVRAASALPAYLVVDSAKVVRTDRTETITIKGHCDAQSETIVVSSFFPYYVPMYGSFQLNGKTVQFDQATAPALDKLLDTADTTSLTEASQSALRMAEYGIHFAAGRWSR